MPTLAKVTNLVQQTLDATDYDGAIWLEGSPVAEETTYWLNLLIDTTIPLCGNSSQRPHGALSSDGDRNIVDSLAYIRSGVWSDDQGRDSVGAVMVQEEQVFTAREVQKGDARPGGYVATGGHGGIVATIGAPGDPMLTFRPHRCHTYRSAVNLSRLPRSVAGVQATAGQISLVDVRVKDADGSLLATAIPKVTLTKYARYAMDDYTDDPAQEVEIAARVARNLERFPLSGFVLEGNSPFGRGDESMTAALQAAVFSGMPVVRVGRGNAEGMAPTTPGSVLLAGSNLTATKARMLLMACLLRFGATPPAADPLGPTRQEREAAISHLAAFQEVFDTH